MAIPVQITFRDIDPSDAIKEAVHKWAEKLPRVFDRIGECKVVIEAPHRHQHKGIHYHVRVEVHVPGEDIVVGRDPADHVANEDVYAAIRDAFKACRRQLEKHAELRHNRAKRHSGAPANVREFAEVQSGL